MIQVNTPIVGFEPKFSSKEARLDSVEPEFSGGYVWIPSEKLKPNIESGYISQMLAFPNGANDGLVDTTSQYLIDERMAKGGKIVNDTDWLGRIWRA
jgi:phage terminase large subunit-like protein